MDTTKKAERVRRKSTTAQNEQKDAEIIQNISYYAAQGAEATSARIKELDREWDIERVLQLNASMLGLTGVLLSNFINKKWLILPIAVSAFLAQHAIQGWCPPLPVLRELGFRTRPEIDREKYALKALRGDFKNLRKTANAWAAVNK